MEDLLKEAFEAGKDLGHAMATGKPTYGLNFKEWREGKALRIHDAVGQSEQLTCECVGLDSTECHKINNKWICSKCNRPLGFNFL